MTLVKLIYKAEVNEVTAGMLSFAHSICKSVQHKKYKEIKLFVMKITLS